MTTLSEKITKSRSLVRTAWQWLTATETYSKSNLFLLAAGLSALLFWPQLVKLFAQFIVRPALSQIPSYWISDLVFGTVFSITLLYFVAHNRVSYRLATRQLLCLLAPGSIYLLVLAYHGHLWGTQWKQTPFHIIRWLRYADECLLLLAGALFLLVRRYRADTLPVASRGYLQEDTSSPTAYADTLHREPAARRLVAQLVGLSPQTAFAIGIVGQWGTGKSYFLDLIARNLPSDMVVIRFNPWLVESTAAIRKEFFSAFKERLSQYSGELATEIGTYANSLSTVYDTTSFKATKELVAFFSDTPTLTEQFKKVDEVIGHIGRKIVVLIDDIDRLDKDEVLETLRIVRNTASFRNTIFLLAYDKQYVLNAISRTNQANSDQYLDKIVQLEISLPDYNPSAVAHRTLELLQGPLPDYLDALQAIIAGKAPQMATSGAYPFLGQGQVSQVDNRFYQAIVTTMRSAVRFANLFAFDFLPLAGEVQLDEMVNLTLLKFRYPILYEAIRTKQVVTEEYHIDTFRVSMQVNPERLKQYFELNQVAPHDQEISRQVLEHLFGNGHLAAGQRTIRRPSTFAIYFSAGNFTNVPFAAIEKLRTGPRVAIIQQLAAWKDNGQLEEAFDVLMAINTFNDRSDFENVVVATLEAGRLLWQDCLMWLLGINEQRQNLVTTFYAQNVIALADFFYDLLSQAPAPYLFEAEITSRLRGGYRDDSRFNFILSDEQLKQLTLHYLTQYLATQPKVDYNAFTLHWQNTKAVVNGNALVEEQANTALRERLVVDKSITSSVLLVPARFPVDERYATFQPFLSQVFGSWDEVETFLQQLPPTSDSAYLQAAFLRFKAAGYKEFKRQPNLD